MSGTSTFVSSHILMNSIYSSISEAKVEVDVVCCMYFIVKLAYRFHRLSKI